MSYNIMAYYLAFDLPEHCFLRIKETAFTETDSGELKFKDKDGIQFVKKDKWNNLEVFELGEHIWLITQNGKFTPGEIKAALVKYHKVLIHAQITALQNQYEKIK